MTHLGERASSLVDGQLAPDAAERAHAHVAGCARCRDAVAAERRVRERLASSPDPAPSDELVERLLALGGPQGPLGPRPGYLPGGTRPAAPVPWDSARPDGRRRPARRAHGVRRGRARFAATAVGALSLVSVGVLGLLLLGGVAARQAPGPAVALGAAGLPAAGTAAPGAARTITTGAVPGAVDLLDGAERAALRADGWLCPERLPGDLRLLDARSLRTGDTSTVQLTYTDGTSTLSVVEHRGRLDPASATAFSQAVTASARVTGSPQVPWHAVWQSGDVVVAVVTDAPPDVVARVVPALPASDLGTGWWDRVGRGVDAVAALLGDA